MPLSIREVKIIKNTKIVDKVIDNDIILYTPQDIQKIFMCGKNQAYQLIHSGGFPKIQINRKIYVPKNKLIKWIESNTGKTVKA